MATEDRVREPGWWPTKGTPALEEFAGSLACAECHGTKAATQKTTPMAHASIRAQNAPILRTHETLGFRLDPYVYWLLRKEDGTTYSVSDGTKAISAPLAWAFGFGVRGQTYVFERDGAFYESRLSYYDSIEGLDFTPGHPRATPASIESALGRRMDDSETHLCFGCHTSASTIRGHFDPAHLTEGVTCEACHGPGAKHVAAMKDGDFEPGKKLIFNPASLEQVASVEFCGACHRTLVDVSLMGLYDVRNVRFQPYRLETSKCWRLGDARLTCLACHNPHQQLVHDVGSYDQRCLQCHRASKNLKPSKDRPGRACPVATQGCVTCHMPKYELPGMHSQFTDHRIRIVRKGAPYPN